MRRRDLLILTAGVLMPNPLRAQQRTMPLIGYLSTVSPGPSASYVAAFCEGLSDRGYVEGQNV